jgi:RNA polymerase sigma-70 factor (ECF subfamily)
MNERNLSLDPIPCSIVPAAPRSHVVGAAVLEGVGTGDAALVARVRSGDAAAFETVFRAYYSPLTNFAFGLVQSPELAEEIVQDVLLHIWAHRSEWAVHENIRSYLYRATRNQALNRLKQMRVVRRFAERVRREPGTAATRVDALQCGVEAEELAMAVGRAVHELPARCRMTFALRVQLELSHGEIAAIMGTTVKTVEVQMRKARKLLRHRLAAWLSC